MGLNFRSPKCTALFTWLKSTLTERKPPANTFTSLNIYCRTISGGKFGGNLKCLEICALFNSVSPLFKILVAFICRTPRSSSAALANRTSKPNTKPLKMHNFKSVVKSVPRNCSTITALVAILYWACLVHLKQLLIYLFANLTSSSLCNFWEWCSTPLFPEYTWLWVVRMNMLDPWVAFKTYCGGRG